MTPAQHQLGGFEINLSTAWIMHFPHTLCHPWKVFSVWFRKQMVLYLLYATNLCCSADQILFCSCKMLKCSGIMSTEEVVMLWFHARLVSSFLHYLFDFSCNAIKLYVALPVDEKFTKQNCRNIDIYVFTRGLPSTNECPRLMGKTDRSAPPLLPRAKKSSCTNFQLQMLIFPASIHHEDQYSFLM